MNTNLTLVSTLLIASAVVLSGCKKKEADAAPEAVVVTTPAATTPETAAAPAPAPAPGAEATASSAPAPAGSTFDINSVPITTAALPPFPYLDWPAKLKENDRVEKEELEFDATNVIVGTEVRSIEGRVQQRYYSLSDAKLSELGAERNYDAVMKHMGAVQVNKMELGDEVFDKVYGDESVIDPFKLQTRGKYKSYLLRTPNGNIWIAITISSAGVNTVAIEEKAMEQSIKPLSAAHMQAELTAKGHVALYLNFDTDKAVILDKDRGTIAEVGRMMADNAALKLKVEGHTDASGDAARNVRLSGQRADAVVASLVAGGVDKARLAALGLGGTKPVADNATEEGRAKNRRVELVKQG